MAFEDIEVRIAKDGKIYVRVNAASEERIQNFREFLEEEIGPIHAMEIIRRPDWDRPAGQLTEETAKRGELELDRNG
jgi:acylphosphatase